MMPMWKRNIFVNVIRTRMAAESRKAGDIIKEYTKLTAEEVTEILAVIPA